MWTIKEAAAKLHKYDVTYAHQNSVLKDLKGLGAGQIVTPEFMSSIPWTHSLNIAYRRWMLAEHPEYAIERGEKTNTPLTLVGTIADVESAIEGMEKAKETPIMKSLYAADVETELIARVKEGNKITTATRHGKYVFVRVEILDNREIADVTAYETPADDNIPDTGKALFQIDTLAIIRAEQFKLFTAILRVVNSREWRDAHPQAVATFGPAWDRLWSLTWQGTFSAEPVSDLMQVVAVAVAADARLQGLYTADELAWLLALMPDRANAKLITSLLGAFFASPNDGDLLTADEASERTGHLSPVRWRDLSAQGKIPGALKRGGAWLIPAPIASAIARRDR